MRIILPALAAALFLLANTVPANEVSTIPHVERRGEATQLMVDGKPFQFELYRIPYNDGAGGEAEPLAGAASNGFSNYFPNYSPDG